MDRDGRPDAGRPLPAERRPQVAPVPSDAGSRPGTPSPRPTVLERATRVLRGLARATVRLAAASLIAGLAVWWAVFQGVDPGEDRTVLLVVLAILLLAPPVVLSLFALALRTLIGLPERLREAPEAVGDRLGEIRRRMAELSEASRQGTVRAFRSLFRLGWSIASSREVLEVSPAVVLLTPGMLVATVFAAAGAVVEILVGAVALLWLALS
jgi:hypothetical protein